MKFTLILFLFLCLNAVASEEEKIATATSIVEITGVKEYKKVFQQSLQKKVQPLFKNYEIDQKTESKIQEIISAITNELSENELRAPYIESYVQTFSLSELEGIRDFFRSPAGQAILAKKSKRVRIESEAMNAILEKTSREIVERIRRDIPEFHK